MYGTVGYAHPVCEGAAAAEHDVGGGQVQPLDGHRIQRQQPPERGLAHTQVLQRGGRDRAAGEAPARTGLVVEQGVDRRFAEHLSHRGERTLGAAHHQQVVMCQRHTLGGHRGRHRGAAPARELGVIVVCETKQDDLTIAHLRGFEVISQITSCGDLSRVPRRRLNPRNC